MSTRQQQFLEAVGSSALRANRLGAGGRQPRDFGRVFTGLLFALFMVTLLLAIATGTRVYGVLAETGASDNGERLATSLLANYVRAADSADGVSAGEGPEGPSLVLTERLDGGTFENRFYLYNGRLVSEYTLADASYSPQTATPIIDTSLFEFSFDQGLLTIATDRGTVDVALRSSRGGA